MLFDVLVIGDANPDLVLRGDVRPRFGQEEQLLEAADLVLGGSAAITATGCARLGLRTGLLAAVGADVFGAFTRERVEERGVRFIVPGSAVSRDRFADEGVRSVSPVGGVSRDRFADEGVRLVSPVGGVSRDRFADDGVRSIVPGSAVSRDRFADEGVRSVSPAGAGSHDRSAQGGAGLTAPGGATRDRVAGSGVPGISPADAGSHDRSAQGGVGLTAPGGATRDRVVGSGVPGISPAGGPAATPTGLSVILSAPGDRAILTLPGTIPALRPGDVTDELLTSARHVHVASLFLQPGLHAGLAEVFARARGLGVSTSLDTNWDPSGRWSGLDEILAVTDVFLPNAAELLAITGAGSVEAGAERLVAGGTTVVLKDGARGGRAWWPGGGSAAAPGLAVDVVDTTGAGDSFNAGFLAARLSGAGVPAALAWAARAGSLSTRAAGGTAAQATPDELAGVIPADR